MFVDYSDSDGEPELAKMRVSSVGVVAVNAKPEADTSVLENERENARLKQISILYKDPAAEAANGQKVSQHLTGKVEKHHMHSFSFDQQFYNFKNRGYAHDPSLDINRMVVDDAKFPELA